MEQHGCSYPVKASKLNGDEKPCVTVWPWAKADGTKLKHYIIFKGVIRETRTLNVEFKGHCIITSSNNDYVNKVVGSF